MFLHILSEAPKSYVFVMSGITCEFTSALKDTVSVSASPNVKLPDIVALPVTARFPATERSAPIVPLPLDVIVVNEPAWVPSNTKFLIPPTE